ncbi:MAG: hydroxyacid dehydrogenase [Micrococcales bacterium]|jgi:phosphoglycerate dehydrogenase-like enzyme|nr:hydroxyacid dehydrogenase [Actinomycetota bacterium]NCA07108.1 hydroxyacid dehydrogenase [Micrococcales bacterium]
MTLDKSKVAIAPKSFPAYEQAVLDSGCSLSPLGETVGALIWTDYSDPQGLARTLSENPQLEFVQLPFAGVDAFQEVLSAPVRFACAKGSYREPVAEHALALALALGRIIPERVRAKTWGRKFAASLYDSKIMIVGAGGITEELLKQLAPFRADITVVRNKSEQLAGASRSVQLDQLDHYLPAADWVFLACSLTDATRGLFDLERFGRMKPTAYFVNVARGAVVVTDDLASALNGELIAGAAVDVTDPEPLPDGHGLWEAKNVIITPHSADTNDQVVRLFSVRIRENLAAYQGLGDWVGLVDPVLGY